MRKIIRPINDYFEPSPSQIPFIFDSETWDEIGEEGTGRLGHYSTQGDRSIYASPRKSRSMGRYRFVLYGTGYWPLEEGGFGWGRHAVEISWEEAYAKCELDAATLKRYFDVDVEDFEADDDDDA